MRTQTEKTTAQKIGKILKKTDQNFLSTLLSDLQKQQKRQLRDLLATLYCPYRDADKRGKAAKFGDIMKIAPKELKNFINGLPLDELAQLLFSMFENECREIQANKNLYLKKWGPERGKENSLLGFIREFAFTFLDSEGQSERKGWNS